MSYLANFFYFNSSTLRKAVESFEISKQLIKINLLLRYRRTKLGPLWMMVFPLGMILSTSLVFSTLFKMDIKTYGLILFSGMVCYQLFSGVITQCCFSMINNESMIKQTPIPLMLFPLCSAVSMFIEVLFLLLSLIIMMIILGANFYYTVLLLPVILICLFFFALGIGLILAIGVIKYRDIGQAVPLVLQIMLFLSPVFYKSDDLVGKLGFLLKLNPLSWFISSLRKTLIYGEIPPISTLFGIIALAVFSIIIGSLFFNRYSKTIPMRL